MKKGKKILSLVLAVIMIVCTVPMVFAEGVTYKVGDIVSFGSYPQSEVGDEVLVAELNALAPEWKDWTSYGYYSGDGNYGSMVQGDWMRYTDITYNGNKYRGVKFTKYRAVATYLDFSYEYQYRNGYDTDIVYWFKFESIDWRVLDPNTGLVICGTIVDSQPYCNTVYLEWSDDLDRFNDASHKNYANDYETSSIRKWLNEDFYNIAFTDSEKKGITITTLNNDGYYTLNGETGYEKFDSSETKDKIFLLSYNDVRNSNFGFDSNPNTKDTARFAQGSDYAQCQGLYINYNENASWFLRSPGSYSHYCCGVTYNGESSYDCYVSSTDIGVRPALNIDLTADFVWLQHKHNHNAAVTNPTCKDKGFTTYTCECGDGYVADYIDMLDHKDDNADYNCDYGCGHEFPKPADPTPDTPDTPSDPTGPCSCNCHKGGIKAFFFKLFNFFAKLFNPAKRICACGMKH